MIVYIAGPYSKGDVDLNVQTAIEAGIHLMLRGYAVEIPHLSHFIHMLSPQSYEFWMHHDAQKLAVCDALVRLPGESAGSDREVALAREFGIPVFYGVDEFISQMKAGGVDA